MAPGGPCALRFFTEGDRLCTTGIAVVPGYSGGRLSNVIRMLSDTDYADSVSGSIFRASEASGAARPAAGGDVRRDLLKINAEHDTTTQMVILTHNIEFLFIESFLLPAGPQGWKRFAYRVCGRTVR